MSTRPLIYDFPLMSIEAACRELGEPAYRARQLWAWLYRRGAADWDTMRNLPASLRQALADRYRLEAGTIVRAQAEAGPGSTTKWLVSLSDGERVETVLIPARGRTTLCVSSQVGCAYRCAFCASGQAGIRRDLSPGEIVGQVMLAARTLGAAPSHLVLMGMGEPLANYEAVLQAIRTVNHPDGLGLGARRITLSTCGLVPGIRRLAGEGLQVELSVSLHAPDDALRSRLMPVNRVHPLADLIEACRAYGEQTGRLITFEYVLIRGVNDAPGQARGLARLLRPVRARVNLIPLSPVREFEGRPPEAPVVARFLDILAQAGLNATVRRSKGAGIQAACGQLRLDHPAPRDPGVP